MKLHPQDIGKVYAAYVDNEIGPKAQSASQKFWAYCSVYVVQKRAQEFLADQDRVAQLTSMGIMCPDGMIDLDFLKEMTTHAMSKSGGKIEAMGLILDQTDIDKVYSIARPFAR